MPKFDEEMGLSGKGLRSNFKTHPFFWSNLRNLKYAFQRRDESLSKEDVTCVIATWDESLVIKYALESSKGFVAKYIIIDKNGSTVEAIKEAKDAFDLDLDIYVKPNLDLRQSRDYGFNKTKDMWILTQDGDEVFYIEGKQRIQTLREYMIMPNIVLCAPKLKLYGSLKLTLPPHIIMPPHTLLYHNNGTIRQNTHPKRDSPEINAFRIGLPHPLLFNCRIKRSHNLKRCIPYDLLKYYPYPKTVLKMMNEGIE